MLFWPSLGKHFRQLGRAHVFGGSGKAEVVLGRPLSCVTFACFVGDGRQLDRLGADGQRGCAASVRIKANSYRCTASPVLRVRLPPKQPSVFARFTQRRAAALPVTVFHNDQPAHDSRHFSRSSKIGRGFSRDCLLLRVLWAAGGRISAFSPCLQWMVSSLQAATRRG